MSFFQANLVYTVFNDGTGINFNCLQKNLVCGFQRMQRAGSGAAQVSVPFMSCYLLESSTDMDRGQG